MSTHPVGGRGGIWTHGRFDPPPVFKTGVLSQTLPPYRVGGSVRTRTLNNPVMSRVLLPVELLTQMFSTLSLLENYTNKLWCGNLYSALPFISAIRPDDTLPNTWFHSYAISELISDVLIGGDGVGSGTWTHTGLLPTDFKSVLSTDSNIPTYGTDDRTRTYNLWIRSPLFYPLNYIRIYHQKAVPQTPLNYCSTIKPHF